jgi:hypothetical protein
MSALTSGGVQLAIFVGLLETDLPLVVDGLLAALVGMAANAALSVQLVHRHGQSSSTPLEVDPLLARLIRVSRADKGAVLGENLAAIAVQPGEHYRLSRLVRGLCRRAGASGVPVLWTEPPSNRPQARSNVELNSVIVLLTDSSRRDSPKVVLHRRQCTPFTSRDLEAAMRQLQHLVQAQLATPMVRTEAAQGAVHQR